MIMAVCKLKKIEIIFLSKTEEYNLDYGPVLQRIIPLYSHW